MPVYGVMQWTRGRTSCISTKSRPCHLTRMPEGIARGNFNSFLIVKLDLHNGESPFPHMRSVSSVSDESAEEETAMCACARAVLMFPALHAPRNREVFCRVCSVLRHDWRVRRSTWFRLAA